LKFGGTSVSSAAAWRVIETVVRKRLEQRKRPLVVHSALAGVSNRLEAIGAGGSDSGDSIDAIERQHMSLSALTAQRCWRRGSPSCANSQPG
jgi:diaminopimelate decarboxylase/aspartate kinase